MKYSLERNQKISKSKTIDYDIIVKKINEANPDLTVLESKETYINTKNKIKVKCNICGYEFYTRPNLIITQHTGCAKCKKNLKYTNETIDEKLKSINSNLIRIDNYINNHTKINFKCNKCGYIWNVKPLKILEGRRCPHCSIPELEYKIEKLLDENNIEYIYQKRFPWLKYKSYLSLDFYLPEYNVGIECQGIQHFVPFKVKSFRSSLENIIFRDNLKNKLCKEHNIDILYFSNNENYTKNYRYELYYDPTLLINGIIKKYKKL